MQNLKNFCDRQRKLRNGHVRDIIDMSDEEKDEAVVAVLKDHGQTALAINHPSLSNDDKNECYSSLELVIKAGIGSYNRGVDLDKELAGDTPLNAYELGAV